MHPDQDLARRRPRHAASSAAAPPAARRRDLDRPHLRRQVHKRRGGQAARRHWCAKSQYSPCARARPVGEGSRSSKRVTGHDLVGVAGQEDLVGSRGGDVERRLGDLVPVAAQQRDHALAGDPVRGMPFGTGVITTPSRTRNTLVEAVSATWPPGRATARCGSRGRGPRGRSGRCSDSGRRPWPRRSPRRAAGGGKGRDGQRHRPRLAEGEVLEADGEHGRFGDSVDQRGRGLARPHHRAEVERPLGAEPADALEDQRLDLGGVHRRREAHRLGGRISRAQCRSRSGVTPSNARAPSKTSTSLPGAMVSGAHHEQVPACQRPSNQVRMRVPSAMIPLAAACRRFSPCGAATPACRRRSIGRRLVRSRIACGPSTSRRRPGWRGSSP